jgi:dTDP-4-dehydrorhamnose reductase
MVGSHFVQYSEMRVHAAGLIDPASLGIPAEGFSPIRFEEVSDLERFVHSREEPVVVNFAAQTDVDRIERERSPPNEQAKEGDAMLVNALAAGAIARAAHAAGKYLIQISTDFVFDGTAGPYDEKSLRSPLSALLSWYGWTKSEGERRVEIESPEAGVLRISYPYRTSFPRKLDFARGLAAKRLSGNLPALYADQMITPTWVPDVTRAINALIRARGSGIFHAASPDVTTPYEFARQLFRQMSGPEVPLEPGSLAATLKRPGTTPRPIRGGLRCPRLASLGVELTGWKEGIDRLVAAEGWT